MERQLHLMVGVWWDRSCKLHIGLGLCTITGFIQNMTYVISSGVTTDVHQLLT